MFRGIQSTTAENTIKLVNTKKNKSVHLLFKGTKGRPPMMNVGQMLDPRINLGDPPKDIVQECGQNPCRSVILSGVNTNIFQKNSYCYVQSFTQRCIKYHNVQLGNIEVNGKIFVLPSKVQLDEHNIVNFDLVFWKCLNKLTQHR